MKPCNFQNIPVVFQSPPVTDQHSTSKVPVTADSEASWLKKLQIISSEYL